MNDLFAIEGLLRARSGHIAILELDAIIIRSDISDDEKALLVQDLIKNTIDGVTENVG